ncbi:hypothetical protein LXA43DRAFT_907186 [Ganoderma leucocontextum]|nr:hypothetical protein LXA43DRAFT_907186 [Ganoderma leucocontextum]
MARFCAVCNRAFPTRRGIAQHRNHYHRRPKPPPPRSTFRFHPHLTAAPCNQAGVPLPPFSPPPPRSTSHKWEPYPNRPSFEFSELIFEKMEESKDDINHLLRILRARDVLHGCEHVPPIFHDADHMVRSIDAIPYGEANWESVAFQYTGPVDDHSPAWKREKYPFHFHNSLQAIERILESPDFHNNFDYVPYQEYIDGPEGKIRRFCNLMSGQWAHKKADEIAEIPECKGSMLTTFMLGADKTTVSVATGNQVFHPVYHTVGNVHNDTRCAHRDAVGILAFLPIPKGDRVAEDDPEFRLFKKQLYHACLAHLLSPLAPGMTTPHVLRCPDGHFRRAIFQLGPFIADYPEQVYLSGIVQRWCPKCLARPEEFENAGDPRSRELTEELLEACDPDTLWHAWGIVRDVTLFTSHFPRADIHELLTPDLLHQLIKGTFKDHLVTWVEEYIRATADSAAEAKRILDDIDRRLAAVPAFPGLRRFPDGCNFQQWTGNDSKALMKVFLPALVGYVPDAMIQCISALLDFSYFARRSAHTSEDLKIMDTTLQRYHELRTVFEDVGIRPNGFQLPRQHALVHYVRAIQLFGSLNGLCSSITESKHIVAVKRPWRRSSRKHPLGQMIRTITRLNKLAAARVEFGRRRMLRGDVYQHSLRRVGLNLGPDREQLEEERYRQEAEAMAAADSESHSSSAPTLQTCLRRFLHDQLHPEDDLADDIPLAECPPFLLDHKLSVFHSATATFYAPSELAGPGGMHSEFIRCSPQWFGSHPRYDTVLVQTDEDAVGMLGMTVARVRLFIFFVYSYVRYNCAYVDWFELESDEPDPVTGMWVVKPEMLDGQRATGVVHVDSIVRACHLIGCYGTTKVPKDFHYADTLDAFRRYYVNWFADYHAHETII